MMGGESGVCEACLSAVQRSLRGEEPWALCIERGNEVNHRCDAPERSMPGSAICLCRCNQLVLPGVEPPPPPRPTEGSLF